MSAAASKPFRIGMLGAGTVGGGVYELVMKQAFPSITISKICVRSLDKPRDFAIDAASTTITTDSSELLTEDIDCLVEVAGGCGVAKDLVLSALQKGKVVVTANKALLAEHLGTIETAAAERNTPIGYEAAVCGGIPIISALSTAYAGDAVQSVVGICNGTTNFMLSAMAEDSTIQYADILKQAQDLGYAEADPTADVEGHDVRAKICILAKLAFGKTVGVEEIPCAGISKITSTDFAYAKDQLQCTIKLIGTAACDEKDQLAVYVTPALVPLNHMLASIDGSGNCVSVTSQNMGTCSLTGPGAGRFPTANSIVADIYRAAEGSLPASAFPVPRACANKSFTLNPDYSSDFYIRIPTTAADISETVLSLGKDVGIEVPPLTVRADCAFAVVKGATKSSVEKVCAAIQQLGTTGEPLFMPIMK